MANEESGHAILNVEDRIRELVIRPMKEMEFFAGMDAKDVMLLSSAIGVRNGMRVPIKKRANGGYSRKEYLKPRETVMIRAMQFAESDFCDAEVLRDEDAALTLFEEYANGGLQCIEGELDRNVSSEELANGFVAEMDSLYEKFTGKAIEL